MSLDLDWDQLTGGPDGEALAESIRAFIDDRFQKVALPKMISSVKVLAFEFGSVAPELELKDVSDPLPDFYEDDEDDEAGPISPESVDQQTGAGSPRAGRANIHASTNTAAQKPSESRNQHNGGASSTSDTRQMMSHFGPWPSNEASRPNLTRSSTPGIPGGTSNMSYFHLPLSAGLSGAATPFGAFGGPHGWLDQAHGPWHHHETGPNGRRISPPGDPDDLPPTTGEKLQAIPEATKEKASEDVQIVAHVRYSGDVKLTLTADILLDYPMPSFVGIPLQLKVTGMTFDGIAVVAYIKDKAHFCFLSPEDADALVGGEDRSSEEDEAKGQAEVRKPVGKLFEQIRVESEIGRRASGKQSLKNVSKVEKFVLEQVRRIFENEFVYPSFWTFLV